jgi:hypothetical protein
MDGRLWVAAVLYSKSVVNALYWVGLPYERPGAEVHVADRGPLRI